MDTSSESLPGILRLILLINPFVGISLEVRIISDLSGDLFNTPK